MMRARDAAQRGAIARADGPSRGPLAILFLAWGLGVIAVVAARFRGDWAPYKELHRALDAMGVPSWVRNLDSLVLFLAAALAGAWIVARWTGGSPACGLGLRWGRRGWGWMLPVALAPMIVGGAVLGWWRDTSWGEPGARVSAIFTLAVRAPIAEEMLFRGLLVGVCTVAIGLRGASYWVNATAAALLFAAVHVNWDVASLAEGWATLLLTGLGGLWYAWLLSRWGTLWVPVLLHAGMNLGWWLAWAQGGAGGGGLVDHLLRAGTITIATWWTIRRTGTSASAGLGV